MHCPGAGAPEEGADSRGNAPAPFYSAPLSVGRSEAMGAERRCKGTAVIRLSWAAYAIRAVPSCNHRRSAGKVQGGQCEADDAVRVRYQPFFARQRIDVEATHTEEVESIWMWTGDSMARASDLKTRTALRTERTCL